MSKIVIKVENLSKQYRLGEIGTGSIAHDLNRWWHKVRQKEDPYTKIGEENERTSKGASEYVWALKDINFEIRQGEAVGIIGRNGAGKSTLLKVLSRTTSPTVGQIKLNGRIASLLEVGTGFHPELTGRDNIFLNGAILGMTQREIKARFDEIVDFAGVERYIDTPVKRYSSGMYVRLAFGVAAHLEPDILIVDEVLAVGDAEFQKKALGKMKEVSDKDGRTVLFVSHSMPSILALTTSTLYMNNGRVRDFGNTSTIVNDYLSTTKSTELIYYGAAKDLEVSILKAEIKTSGLNNIHFFGQDINIEFTLNVPIASRGNCLSFQIFDLKEKACFYNWIFDSEQEMCRERGVYRLSCTIPRFKLYKGKYNITVHLAEQKGKTYYGNIEGICPFEVVMDTNHEWGWGDDAAVFLADHIWKVEKLQS